MIIIIWVKSDILFLCLLVFDLKTGYKNKQYWHAWNIIKLAVSGEPKNDYYSQG